MFGPATVSLFDNPGDLMSGNWDSSLPAPLSALLEALGYAPSDAVIRESTVPALRGTNVVLLSTAVGALCDSGDGGTSWLSRTGEPDSGAGASLRHSGMGPGTGPARPRRITHARNSIHALPARRAVCARKVSRFSSRRPEVALQLCRRSALKAESLSHIVLAWPESCENPETLTQILQDANKDAQRLLIPLSPAPSRDLTDRYARRGVVAGPFAAQAPTKSTVPVQYAITVWNARSSALQNALETLDPAGAVIWTADGASAEEVRAALPVAGETTVVTGDVDDRGVDHLL